LPTAHCSHRFCNDKMQRFAVFSEDKPSFVQLANAWKQNGSNEIKA
jgi:hypothetical protein